MRVVFRARLPAARLRAAMRQAAAARVAAVRSDDLPGTVGRLPRTSMLARAVLTQGVQAGRGEVEAPSSKRDQI